MRFFLWRKYKQIKFPKCYTRFRDIKHNEVWIGMWPAVNTHRLVGLSTTLVTGVGGHLQHGLHLCTACHNASHLDQFANVGSLHSANRLWLLCWWCLEIHLAVGREQQHSSDLWDQQEKPIMRRHQSLLNICSSTLADKRLEVSKIFIPCNWWVKKKVLENQVHEFYHHR